jgi:hypothetical protein
MDKIFTIVTEDFLGGTNLKYYKGGKELKVGDKIISGCTIGYSNLNGISSSTFNNHDDASRVNLKMFVYDETSKVLFELYSIK